MKENICSSVHYKKKILVAQVNTDGTHKAHSKHKGQSGGRKTEGTRRL